MTRYVAIDWSGAKSVERSKIWYAEVQDGCLVRLEDGRNRVEIIQHVIEEADKTGPLIVGLDFAFSFPHWFVKEGGGETADQVWSLARKDGEAWLSRCEPPFWGRPGKKRPELPEHLRSTEVRAGVDSGFKPKSVFQVGGAGAVGTGSIRGMPT